MDDLLFRGGITILQYIVERPEDEDEVDAFFLVVRHFRVMISELGT